MKQTYDEQYSENLQNLILSHGQTHEGKNGSQVTRYVCAIDQNLGEIYVLTAEVEVPHSAQVREVKNGANVTVRVLGLAKSPLNKTAFNDYYSNPEAWHYENDEDIVGHTRHIIEDKCFDYGVFERSIVTGEVRNGMFYITGAQKTSTLNEGMMSCAVPALISSASLLGAEKVVLQKTGIHHVADADSLSHILGLKDNAPSGFVDFIRSKKEHRTPAYERAVTKMGENSFSDRVPFFYKNLSLSEAQAKIIAERKQNPEDIRSIDD